MKMPIDCPICQHPLMTCFYGIGSREYVVKDCERSLTHKIEFTSLDDNFDLVELIATPNDGQDWNKGYISWDCLRQCVDIYYHNPSSRVSLPFFEPDLSNYPGLLNKLKTYMVFS